MSITEQERINTLKTLCRLANSYLEQYKELCNADRKKWENKKSQSAIASLKEIISRINLDLHPENVKRYCRPMPAVPSVKISEWNDPKYRELTLSANQYFKEQNIQVQPAFLQIDIIRLAPDQNVVHDIGWLSDGTVGDYFDIATGKKDVTTLSANLPISISDVKIIAIPFLKSVGDMKAAEIINYAIAHSRKQQYLASNILLITVIESIVRSMCKYLYNSQNPHLTQEELNSFIYEKYTSLESLIAKGGWPDDYPISISAAIIEYWDVSEPTIDKLRERFHNHTKAYRRFMDMMSEQSAMIDRSVNNAISPEDTKIMLQQIKEWDTYKNDLLTEEEMNTKINLCTMLNFLIRKYKDDRNAIIHGNFELLNQEWKNYINYAAIMEVLKVYNRYLKIYPRIQMNLTSE